MRKYILANTLLIAACLLLPLGRWSELPPSVPIHWGLDTQPDGWAPRGMAVLIAPFMALVSSLSLGLLARKEKDAGTKRALRLTTTLITLLFLGLQLILLQAALQPQQRFAPLLLSAVIGLCLIGIAAILPSTTINPWIGVRTPWSKSSEAAWKATHKFAAVCLAVGGLLILAAGNLPPQYALIATIAIAALSLLPSIPASWYFARRTQRAAASDKPADRPS